MQPAPTPDRLPLREYLGYALGDTASNLFFQTFNIFLTYYYVDVWGIPAAALLLMFPLVRLWDAVNDPIMGIVADRTRSRWGKFRPYLLWGAVPYGVCGYLMFAGPDLSAQGKIVYAYVTYTLMLMAYTVINVPYSSLLGVISPSSRTRTVASSFRFVGAFGGGLLISMFVRPLVKELGGDNETLGFQYTMAIFGALSIAMFWITFATTKERVTPPPQQKTNVLGELRELVRNGPWLALLLATIFSTTFIALRSGSTLFYFKYCVGDTGAPVWLGRFDASTLFLASGMASMMLGTLCLGVFARRIDKKPLAIWLTTGTAIAYAAFYFLPTDNFALLLTVNALGTFCMGPTSALVWAMYADVADYGEWKFSRRSTGLIYSASLFALKTGIMVGGFVLPWFLDFYGFVPNITQTPRALEGILLAFSLGAGAFAGLKALALVIYPLNQREVDRVERELRERRGEPAVAV
ncbi:MFS transporter [Opitutus terrae]|uniref:Sugar (Glycoside-Pentoside-Hexuronide) transporter n=1 Tax=Opitutus terrae (strain DSM 11246 / JCM 15787 / PB90-1) TaxID=452637 RepID=B1ZQ74_OPITP|nr:MFS transporter [Opitutus terrae]ACB77795.1 sugar (Glycoside-Pentoside-Hexuronide) transporter [Opitutus terrae PB90-1]